MMLRKRVMSLVLALSLLAAGAPAFAAETPAAEETTGENKAAITRDVKLLFTDVKVNDWFVSYVQFAYDNGIMTGTSLFTFGPNETLTRGQTVQILYAMEGKPKVSGAMKFPDVQKGEWDYDAILWASQQGIVAGYDTGDFGPKDDVTREQLALILYQKAGAPAVSGALTGFTDANTASAWAYTALVWATQNNIMRGSENEDGTFSLQPQKSVTRAETAVMMQRYVELTER